MILKKDNDNSPQMTSPHCEKNRGKETMAGSCFTFRSVMINNGSPATTQISAVMIINGFNPWSQFFPPDQLYFFGKTAIDISIYFTQNATLALIETACADIDILSFYLLLT